jgi:RimJ/RimL family protein N-acetyltransferase
MSVRFYIREHGESPAGSAQVPEGYALSIWRPRSDGLPPPLLKAWPNAVWWAFDHLGVFANRRGGVLMLLHDGELAHSALVTPRWFRFPQMGPRDLQIGDVWTAPEHRGRGLAKAGVQLIADRWRGLYQRLWYLVDDDNAASIRVIERCGFRLLGDGGRTRPLGLGLIGRYHLVRQA